MGVKSNATYDENNQLLKLTVNGVEQLKNTYDSQGNLIESRDALGRTTTFTYQEKGRPRCITRPDGSSVSLSYDEKGNIIGITDPYGNRSSYEYDSLNRIICATDSRGGRTTYEYDNMNRMTSFTNPLGQKTEYRYNAAGKQTEVCRADGGTVKTEYNSLNRPCAITNADGKRAEFTYDSMWNLFGVHLPNGAKEQYCYNSRNRLSSVTDALGNRTEYEYDANGNRILVRSPKGEETRYTYNARNQVTAATDGEGNTTAYEYDERGLLVKQIDALGSETTITYDEAGQKTSETDALGNTTCYTYTPLGKIESVTSAKGRTMRYEYEAGGRLSTICHTDGRKETFTYDENGNVKTHTDASGYTCSYEYDALNRILQMTGSGGEEKHYTYDILGNVSSITDALGNVTVYEYSMTGLLTKVTDALGNETSYEYDVLGNLTQICQHGEEDHVTRYERNLKGQVEMVTDALEQTECYTYDANGQLSEKKDKQGFVTGYGYTALGDVKNIRYADGREAELSYNPLRQLTQVKDWLGVTKIENDALGRTTKVIQPDGKEIAYTYGEAGERTSLTYPDGKKVYYGYDKDLRLSELKEGDSIITYGYDENGKLAEKNFPNGIHTSYHYDEAGRIRELIHEDKEGVLDSYRYTYDLLGNKTGIRKERRGLSEESGSWTYSYDALGRLSEVRKEGELHTTYSYDAFGNRIHESGRKGESLYTYNALNQLICRKDILGEEVQETGYTYDPRGNLTEILENGVQKNRYRYGAMNRLEEAEDRNGYRALYDYNGLGFRVSKQVGEQSRKPFQKIQYTLDLTRSYHNLLEKEENSRTQTFLWDGNVAGMLEEETNTANGTEPGTRTDYRYYLQDELGSPIRFTDAEGNLTETYGYGVFGEDLYQNQGEVQPFGYTGYQKDEVAGTYFAQAREYLPEAGRFAAKDVDIFIKIPKPISINQYIYCNENPVNYIDLTGYDSYIFYTTAEKSDYSNQAEWKKEELIKTGLAEEEIHMIEVKNISDFEDGWNGMGDNGKVSIDNVYIYTHGTEKSWIFKSGSSTNGMSIDGKNKAGEDVLGNIRELEIKYVNNRVEVYSCNAGNYLVYINEGENVASVLSTRVENAAVYGYDGNVAFGKGAWKFWSHSYEDRLSHSQKHYHEVASRYGAIYSEPMGKLTYYNGEYKKYGWYPNTKIESGRCENDD